MADRKTGAEGQANNTHGEPAARVMTLDQAVEAFPDEWIFTQITHDDRDDRKVAGIVLAHHPRRSGISATEIAVMSNPPSGAVGFYTFHGVPRIRSHDEWLAFQASQSTRDDRRA
jgi:hypothetical protein